MTSASEPRHRENSHTPETALVRDEHPGCPLTLSLPRTKAKTLQVAKWSLHQRLPPAGRYCGLRTLRHLLIDCGKVSVLDHLIAILLPPPVLTL